MLQVISENPDRETLGNNLKEVQEELEQLKEVEEGLDEKLEMRKKSFHVMIHSIQQLQVKGKGGRAKVLMFATPLLRPFSECLIGMRTRRGSL